MNKQDTRMMYVILIYLLMFLCPTSIAHTITQFYYARLFDTEPRFTKPWLASGKVRFMGSSSDFAYDTTGRAVPLLDIYGTHDIRTWSTELPEHSPGDTIHQCIEEIAHMPASKAPNLSIDGNFRIFQTDVAFTQNFEHGIFVHIHTPLLHTEFARLQFNPVQTSATATWSTCIENISTMLQRFNIQAFTPNTLDFGDTTCSVGYTYTFDDTEYIDFCDITVQTGILFPTGREPKTDIAFDIPYGFNGHTGFLLTGDIAWGIYDWLVFGLATHNILFTPHTRSQRLSTSPTASGWFHPQIQCTHVEGGSLRHVSIYTKADHVLKGLSILFGFSHEHRSKQNAFLQATDMYDQYTTNAPHLRGWKKNTFHWYIAYDFATYEHPFAPEITVFCNHVLDGRNVFESSNGGMSLQCNFMW